MEKNEPVDEILRNLPEKMREAVKFYWQTRSNQKRNQVSRGVQDQGSRSAVTGGAQMDKFLEVITNYLFRVGISKSEIFCDTKLELPGFFRPNKKWDLLVVKDGKLLAALEAKSQVGSFGNNFNNRTEEAMGSALDIWTAFREGAFNKSSAPWMGYIFLLQKCKKSNSPVRVDEPHFPVFKEFKNSSYSKRYELFCRKLVRERHYQSSAFLLSDDTNGLKGEYDEPADDLTLKNFLKSMLTHIKSYV